ncbi:MAG: DUF4276 family protein [Pseudomonadales bacterium]|nr:DUF4276 family protein [Pseudomonadales bacterium]
MVRVGISVEGQTEERFVKSVLAPYLVKTEIYIMPISMSGDVNIDKVREELKKIAFNFDFVTTLYDFYGFSKKESNETKASLEARILKSVHQSVKDKLIPYVQMYEFEGLLFSCPESMGRVLQDIEVQKWASEVLHEFENNPELINDSVETAPSKRLGKFTRYRKTTHGPNIAKEIGIDKIRTMCVGFDEWIQKIESLAGGELNIGVMRPQSHS